MEIPTVKAVLCCIGILLSASALAQKPPIPLAVLGTWPRVDESPRISNDGRYAAYVIQNFDAESSALVIQAIESTWKREFAGVDPFDPYFFSADSRQLVFKRGDALHFLSLGTGEVHSIDIISYQSPRSADGEWVAYQKKDAERELVLRNYATGAERRFPGVTEYLFDDHGRVLLIKTESVQGESPAATLQWIALRTGKAVTIWSSEALSSRNSMPHSYKFDAGADQLTFLVEEKRGENTANTLWYYKAGMARAEMRVNERSPGMQAGLSVAGAPAFSRDGRWIFFQLQSPVETLEPGPEAVKVDVWGYRDTVLQPEQMRRANEGSPAFTAVVRAQGNRVVRLQREGEEVRTLPEQITSDFIVLADHADVPDWWPHDAQSSYYLVSLQDGSRKVLRKEVGRNALSDFSFSPHGKYMVFWDVGKAGYFSYETATGRERNITEAIPTDVTREAIYRVDQPLPVEPVASVAGWHQQDTSLLIYDTHDIWQIDPAAARPAVNITDGFGRLQNIKFRLAYGPGILQDRTAIVFRDKEPLLLTAFNTANKHNGFYRARLDSKGPPELLVMGPYAFWMVDSQMPHWASFGNGMPPLKARRADRWIVQRQSATEAQNYFWTGDFRTYTALSSLQPQGQYNWLTTELITWKSLDGTPRQGVLYKPENFDATRKYPVIFNYYRQLAHRLYQFPYPYFTDGNINIPWFVSNGYLVFTPDIHYSVRDTLTCESAYNSIVSAAQYLASLPFVDKAKMGLQGHSFGGAQTNYIITRTGMFAAAAEFAGGSDPVSRFLTLAPFLSPIEHWDSLSRTESTAGATPWERPDLYIRKSTVLNADKITTPLLITHNMKDEQIPWRQGVQLYMALRRLGKKAWMLQYDDEIHLQVFFKKNKADYHVRLTQFFDHYLKGAPPPEWMTKGVPARLKGIDTGLELDTSGKIP